MTIGITGPDDPRIADYLELSDPQARARRERDEFFIVEGPIAIERLVASRLTIRSVLLTDKAHRRLAATLAGIDAPVYVTTSEVMNEIAGFDIHRGAVASATRQPLGDLDHIIATAHTIAVLEGLNDPENLGAIARSALALGVDGLIVDPTCIDPLYRRTVRVSMGAVLFLPIARAPQWPQVIEDLARRGFETWAMTPDPAASDLWSMPSPQRLALVFGAEGAGLGEGALAACSARVRIDIDDHADSLNVAAAAAVAFAERRRRLRS